MSYLTAGGTSVACPSFIGNPSGVPSWVLPGATVDMDFADSLYYGGTLANLLSVTNSTGGYVTNADGTLTLIGANLPRIGSGTGLLVEQSSTNTALHSRDMTQASWVAVNMTTALNATGADGVANSATTLTATAGNATILQALTIGSTTETYSVYLKRVSGTGTINISENGGSSWTPCTINSTSFTRCFVEASLANPSVGIQIVTNGDVIVADFNQNEALAFPTSPIVTTTTSVARAADAITAVGVLSTTLNGASGSAYVKSYQFSPAYPMGTLYLTNREILSISTATNQTNTYNGATNINATSGGADWTVAASAAMGWDGTGRSIVMGNGTVATGASTFSGSGTYFVGSSSGSSRFVNGYFNRISVWNARQSDAILKALSNQ
jgi:hypothetical protein